MWVPQPGQQLAAIEADWCDDLFYGGERGGGKSDYQLGYQEDGALRYGDKHRGIMFRKTYAELEELQARALEIFPAEGAVFRTQPSASVPFSNAWFWPNGATCKMRYIENEKDYGRYHGHSYTRISFDEVTEYASPRGLLKMSSTLRSPHGVPCTMRLTGNPGGIGHVWVKARYISVAPPMTPYIDPDSGFTRLFVPSRTEDNQILLKGDPLYRNRIKAATGGNEALRKAWLEGDWNIVAGAFFDCWDSKKHVLRPFEIPRAWPRFRSGDWGSARPYSFGWWAVVPETFEHDGQVIPRGALIRYRELYGAIDSINQPNVGTKETAEEVGKRIAELEKYETVSNAKSVLDPATFSSDGGPSIAERIYKGSGKKVNFRRADNTRVGKRGAMAGWDQMRARFIGEDDRPMLYCFSTCLDSVRTVPMLQHDDLNIEDVDTKGEDHAGDDWRYACNSRPFTPVDRVKKVGKFLNEMTLDELFAATSSTHSGNGRI